MSKPNTITAIKGLTVGNAEDSRLKTGVTALLCETPTIGSCHVMGAAPGTRDTELLAPENTVERIDGLVLAGGSAFGLDAASGVQAFLREQGKGFEVAGQRIPIVPAAILFDRANGGTNDWGRYPPWRELGYQAAKSAARDFDLGSAGAGHGATVAGLKGGLGSAAAELDGTTIAALVAVNAVGSPIIGESGHFWAAPFERDAEFGGFGLPARLPQDVSEPKVKHRDALSAGANTTIGIIATDAELTKPQAKRLAMAAHDGFARALYPVHTPFDGDCIFSLATGGRARPASAAAWIDLCAFASTVMARAIARGVHAATAMENDIFPTWRERYGKLLARPEAPDDD